MLHRSLFCALLAFTDAVYYVKAVTVYSQVRLGQSTRTTTSQASNTAHATYDPKELTPPILPNLTSTLFALSLGATNDTQSGLSMPVPGSFYGFSIEMSVANQICAFHFHVVLLNAKHHHSVGKNS